MNIGISAGFRHNPADGLLIPASTVFEGEDSKMNGKVLPIIGFLACRSNGKTYWNFIKYEADELWHESWGKSNKRARISTTRVADVTCSECGSQEIMPVWGKNDDVPCMHCGKKGCCVNRIKEGSAKFFELLGDLKDPLEKAAEAAELDPAAPEFRFPDWIVAATNINPSPSIDPAYQSKARSMGFTLRLGSEIEFPQGMFDLENHALFLDPRISSGVIDDDMIERDILSWSKTEGSLTQSLSCFCPKPKPAPRRYKYAAVRI